MANNANIFFGVVKNINDETGAGRIQARVSGDDWDKKVSDLQWAHPLLPKMLHIMPKVDETVLIIKNEDTSERYYIGPIISQPQFMYKDYPTGLALKGYAGSLIGYDENPNTYPEVIGSLPKTEDIAILGRKDSDIILKDDDIRIRCGVKKTSETDMEKFEFNGVHPAFIKLKHYNSENETERGYESAINLVADKVNIIGCASKDKKFKTNDKDELISDEEVDKFIKEAHQVPFGDTLIEFLKIFINAFQSHTHPFVGNGKTPCKDATYNALANYELNDILSDTVRIN